MSHWKYDPLSYVYFPVLQNTTVQHMWKQTKPQWQQRKAVSQLRRPKSSWTVYEVAARSSAPPIQSLCMSRRTLRDPRNLDPSSPSSKAGSSWNLESERFSLNGSTSSGSLYEISLPDPTDDIESDRFLSPSVSPVETPSGTELYCWLIVLFVVVDCALGYSIKERSWIDDLRGRSHTR